MRNNGSLSGLILGVAAGDCLGTPYIFMKSDVLFEQGPKICWEVSETGISTQLMMAAMSVVARHGVDDNALVRAYHRCTKQSLDMDYVTSLRFGGRNRTAQKCREETSQDEIGAMCSNQILIREIPIVLAHLGQSRDQLFDAVDRECTLTHDDPEVMEYARLYALCLQGIMQKKSRVEIWDSLFESVKSSVVYRTLLNSYYEKPVCDSREYSHIGTAFGLSLYHFWHDTPFVSALRSAVLMGGATDVNAAATGAVIGAWQGIDAIPEAWRSVMLDDEAGNGTGEMLLKTLKWGENIVRQSGYCRPEFCILHWHSSRRCAEKWRNSVRGNGVLLQLRQG